MRTEFALVVAVLLAGPLFSGQAIAQSKVQYEFHDGPDFQGAVHRATYDLRGVAWISTPNQLFKVETGRPRSVDSRGASDRRLVLAPGGRQYTWLTNDVAVPGRFTIELLDLNRPAVVVANLEASGLRGGFTTFHVGKQGNLLVGAVPLQDLEGLRGHLRYIFWSPAGVERGSVDLPEPRIGIVDETAQAIALLGEMDAVAFAGNGTRLWIVSGHYRKGVLGRGGQYCARRIRRERLTKYMSFEAGASLP